MTPANIDRYEQQARRYYSVTDGPAPTSALAGSIFDLLQEVRLLAAENERLRRELAAYRYAEGYW